MYSKLYSEKIHFSFDDVLIRPVPGAVESRSHVKLERELKRGWRPIPVVSANMDTVTGEEMAETLVRRNWVAALHKYLPEEAVVSLFARLKSAGADLRNLFVSFGNRQHDREQLERYLEIEPGIQSVCIDIANGYRKSVSQFVSDIKKGSCRERIVMVGNVATAEGARMLADAGADIVKVGIGPGSVCTTRVQTGVGVPQLSAVMEIRDALQGQALICADGGCRNPGDVAKAFAAGADLVMLGGMLAGHRESASGVGEVDGKSVVRFSGMAAEEGQPGSVPEYAAAEGKTVYIPYRGHVERTLKSIEGGLRSACTYTGSENLEHFVKNAMLIRSTVQENHIFSGIPTD